MATVRWTVAALSQLNEIYDFAAQASVEYASRIVSAILSATRPLAQFPRLGRTIPEFSVPEFRELIVERFRILYSFYGVDDVVVFGVIDGRRDFKTHVSLDPRGN